MDQSASISSQPQREWWREFFDDDYAAYGLAVGDPADVAELADFIIRTLELKPGELVFDQCCGIGRMSLPLAEKGMRVIGVDLVHSYIEAAKQQAAQRKLNCEFHCADAHEFTAPRPCDAAINWFTSFGYAEDDERTRQMFQRAFDSLRPGGRAIFEYQNIPRILAEFQHAIVSRPAGHGLDGLLIIQENTPDFVAGMMRGKWSAIYPDGRRTERDIQTRLFMPHEIVRLLARCGFGDFNLLGSRQGEGFGRTSKRLIVTCRKAE